MNFIVNSYLWIIVVFAYYFLLAYLSFRAKKDSTNTIFLIMWGMSALPIWSVICKYTNNVTLSAFIYDILYVTGWSLGLIVFTDTVLTITQYISVAGMIGCTIMFKVGGE